MCSENTCQASVLVKGCSISGLRQKCGRPVKGVRVDGTCVCGIHLRQDQRRTEFSRALEASVNTETRKREEQILRIAKWYAAEEHDGVDLWLGYSSTDQELYCKYAEKIIAVVEGR
jgi:hypothetical protein